MANIHEALAHLSPVDWSDVPKDDLKPYLTEAFAAGELIVNSVPALPNGTPFDDAKPHNDTPNSASSHKDMHSSTALSPPPSEEHSNLAKNWGKPQKFKNNPLNIQLYKMAGNDRNGAWFARKSVHEGLGFDKMKRAMLREFPLSLSVKGGPGAGAVRGIAADQRLERIDVDGVGKLEVYQMSAQFPGPTTPREFVAMLLSTDEALTDVAAEVDGGKKHIPRHFMLVSRPIQHPDADERDGYVLGKYESVEMIREIPLSTAPAKITRNVLSDEKESEDSSSKAEGTAEDPELNPVEWIMVTRSDPGGGLPRFLVERGTPETMLTDVHKFFDWACSQPDTIPHPDEDLADADGSIEPQAQAEAVTDEKATTANVPDRSTGTNQPSTNGAAVPAQQTGSQGGIMSSLTAAIETYAPASVANMVHAYSQPIEDDSSDDDTSDDDSTDSFLSADEMKRVTTAPETPLGSLKSPDTLSIASADLSDGSAPRNHHDREVAKLAKKRERLDQKLAKKRMDEQAKLKHLQEKDSEEHAKYQEKVDKELQKTEEKHRKEIEKLEQKKAKEARKAELRRAKKDDQTKINMIARERDEFRSQGELYKRENALLQKQVAELQSQNNLMAQKLGQAELQGIQDETNRQRTSSILSSGSSGSGIKG